MDSFSTATTIYALASAAGKSGVAVFRISGPDARAVLPFLGVRKILEPRMACLVTLRYNETVIDQALALFFPSPHSFTGEDIVELHTHGSRAVIKLLYQALSACPGLRMAESGEFARRAFLAGKLDLAQAEGLADLIDAESRSQHNQALRQLSGTLSTRIETLREAILTPLALLEAYIDFPDEEIPPEILMETQTRIQVLKSEIQDLLNDNHIGEKIRDGLEIVILGPPNAGKSSLLNLLAKRDAAIVSPEAGTTRDLIEVHMEIAGFSVTLIDTAGLREAENTIEAEGIRRGSHRAKHADLTLYVTDATQLSASGAAIPQEAANLIILANKCDVTPLPKYVGNLLPVSVKTGAGISEMLTLLTNKISTVMETYTPPLITQARHREALQEALQCLQRLHLTLPCELLCEELRLTARAIGKITGKIAVDDILDLVFSRFCIGK